MAGFPNGMVKSSTKVPLEMELHGEIYDWGPASRI